jgi:hypothetical protein
VIWNANPLSNYARAEQTWVDGRKYFDRAEDLEARKRFAAEREALVQKALAERVKELGKPKDGENKGGDEKKGEAKPSEHHDHRAHEFIGVYHDGHDRHNCSQH